MESNAPPTTTLAGSGPGGANGPPRQAEPAAEHNLQRDLAALARLRSSQALTQETTGYVADALQHWVLVGQHEPWPDAPPPPAGPSPARELADITDRFAGYIQRAQPLAHTFELAHVGRLLTLAVRCEQDPQEFADYIERQRTLGVPRLELPPGPDGLDLS